MQDESFKRKEKLDEIKRNDKPSRTGLPLIYKGETKYYDVYRIPLNLLRYNSINGRIADAVKSYTALNGELFQNNDAHQKIIEQFLYESRKDRNEETMKDLVIKGQEKHGIVTADGVIIDGNRRAMLLNRLHETGVYNKGKIKLNNVERESCGYFLAIILPDTATEKDIHALETQYQMAEDPKVEYNIINKYIKCRDLKNAGKTLAEIAEFMREKEKKIKINLEVLDLMDEYLATYDSHYIYTQLNQKEDQFLHLYSLLKRYQTRLNGIKPWDYNEMDLSDLKLIGFDYIRAAYEGKAFRRLFSSGQKNISVFDNKHVWEEFKENHFAILEDRNEEKLDDYKKNYKGDINNIYKSRDADWKGAELKSRDGKTLTKSMDDNAKDTEARISNIVDQEEPNRVLQRALNSIKDLSNKEKINFNEKTKSILKSIKEYADNLIDKVYANNN